MHQMNQNPSNLQIELFYCTTKVEKKDKILGGFGRLNLSGF